ncbi:MAG: bifunctional DNA-formamidopyrimidine glycosylase/DNA-(apurinic or apyrimidinic site) lyase [Desulfobacterales bacterium]|jgi:formamidopyrimidine-DNA glycosylase
MPELPEVQTIVGDLKAAGIEGAVITGATVFWPRTIAEPSANAFCRRIRGKKISVIRRRGKFIVFDFKNGDNLLMHLRMSGRLHLIARESPRKKHEHVVLHFKGGKQLRFHDTRKFGRIYLTSDSDKILGRLGPEPLADGFTWKMLARRLSRRQRLLKPLLLDQTFIAGLGNIYVDEALWESKIHPCRTAASLTEPEIRMLHRAIPRVLKRGLKNLGTSLGTGKANFYSIAQHQGRNRDKLNVFRRTDHPCPRCQTKIQRIIVGQRSTHICPTCQVL